MTYFWRYENSGGEPQDGPAEHFADRAAAEEWLSAHWRDLADRGIDQVTLVDGAEPVYGPMSLHAP